MHSKKCTACHKTKPIVDFYRDSTRKDGYSFVCRECSRAAKSRAEAVRVVRVHYCDCGRIGVVLAGGHSWICARCRELDRKRYHSAGNLPRPEPPAVVPPDFGPMSDVELAWRAIRETIYVPPADILSPLERNTAV